MVACIKTHRNPSPTTSKIFSQKIFTRERKKEYPNDSSPWCFKLWVWRYWFTEFFSHCLPCLSKHICNWGSFSFCFLQSLKNCDIVTYQNVHVNWWFFFHLLQSLNEFSCYNLKWSGYVWICLGFSLNRRNVSYRSVGVQTSKWEVFLLKIFCHS